jgi:hypothetical protein
VAKANQPAATHQQLQAEGEDGVDHDLADQIDAEVAADERITRERDKGGQDEREFGCVVWFHCFIPP